MFTARILIVTAFLGSFLPTVRASQVRLNPYVASAVSPQKAFTYGVHYLQEAALYSNTQPEQIEQAIEKMISCWNSAALNYNPEAAYALGDLYEIGTLSELRSLPEFAKINAQPACCKRDLDKALAMYTLAAQHGRSQTFQSLKCESTSIHAMAINGLISLGIRFQKGLGTEQDLKKAADCFKRANDNGGKVPSYLYREKTSIKASAATESSPRMYTDDYNNLTVDTTYKSKAAPRNVQVPPTTVVTPPQQTFIMQYPVFYYPMMSWGWVGCVVQRANV